MRIESFPDSALDSGTGRPSRCVAIASSDPLILFGIDRPEVNLAIWDREVAVRFRRQTLRLLMAEAPFTAIAEGPPRHIADLLCEQLPVPLTKDLAADVTDLAWAFAELDGDNGFVRVRLEALTHDSCHRWHADAVGLRMLCTYLGPGTEWLPLEGGAAAARGIGPGRPPCSVAQIATGVVAVMKGEGYAGNAGNGCIHRSPPAGPGARARLLLCVDQTRWNLPDDT